MNNSNTKRRKPLLKAQGKRDHYDKKMHAKYFNGPKTYTKHSNHDSHQVCLYDLIWSLQNNPFPTSMGKLQDKELDKNFPELYKFNTYNDLIMGLNMSPKVQSGEDQRYFTYKWFLLKCTYVDKQLLTQAGFKLVYDGESKSYQLNFKNVPFELRETKVKDNLFNESKILDISKVQSFMETLYKDQSKARYSLGNKLFIGYYSENEKVSTNKLRASFNEKLTAFKQMCKDFSKITPFKVNDSVCYFIMVHCTSDGVIKTHIPGLEDDTTI